MSIYDDARQAIADGQERKRKGVGGDAIDDVGVAAVLTMVVRVAENMETMTNLMSHTLTHMVRLGDALETLAKAFPSEEKMAHDDPDQPPLFGKPCGHDHG